MTNQEECRLGKCLKNTAHFSIIIVYECSPITDGPWIMSKSSVVAPPTEAMVCSLALSWWRVEMRARLQMGNWRSRSLRGEE